MVYLVEIFPYNDGDGISSRLIDTFKMPSDHPLRLAIEKSNRDGGNHVKITTGSYDEHWERARTEPPCYVDARAVLVEV